MSNDVLRAVVDALTDHPNSTIILRATPDALRLVSERFAATGWTVDIAPAVDTLCDGIRISPPLEHL
jgi:hypothetical protein